MREPAEDLQKNFDYYFHINYFISDLFNFPDLMYKTYHTVA